jgi:acyl carrier protein
MIESRTPECSEEAVLARLKELARTELNMSPEQIAMISPEAPIVDALRLDSLAQVVLVTNMEQDFDCTFEADDWQTVETVGDLVKMVSARAGQAHRE